MEVIVWIIDRVEMLSDVIMGGDINWSTLSINKQAAQYFNLSDETI